MEREEYQQNKARQQSKQQQLQQRVQQQSTRIQELESSKAELLGELRDRNEDTIRLSTTAKNDKIEADQHTSELQNEMNVIREELDRCKDDMDRKQRKVAELQETLGEERERKQSIQHIVDRLQAESTKHRAEAKEKMDEQISFQRTTENLRSQLKEHEDVNQKREQTMEEERTQQRQQLAQVRTEFEKERTEIIAKFEEKRKQTMQKNDLTHRSEKEEWAKDKAGLLQQHAEMVEKMNAGLAEEHELHMQSERTALREELNVIQQHMNQKVKALEDCVRGLTSEGEKYQTRILEQNTDLERSRDIVHQHRGKKDSVCLV